LHNVVERIQKIRPDFSYAIMDGGTYHLVYDEGAAWAKIVADFVLENKA
jgi:hypothetical protein